MRLSRANIPLASEDRTHSQAISPYPHYNLAPHFWPGFINLQHFCHSRWRNPVRLSKSGQDSRLGYLSKEGITLLEALRYIPGMSRRLSRMGLQMRTLRTHVRQVTQQHQSFTNITIQPNF